MNPLLRYKPLLKAARGTPEYPLVRELLRDVLFRRHLQRLLEAQNTRLLSAARDRDMLLYERRR